MRTGPQGLGQRGPPRRVLQQLQRRRLPEPPPLLRLPLPLQQLQQRWGTALRMHRSQGVSRQAWLQLVLPLVLVLQTLLWRMPQRLLRTQGGSGGQQKQAQTRVDGPSLCCH